MPVWLQKQCRESEAAAVRATSTRVILNDDDEGFLHFSRLTRNFHSNFFNPDDDCGSKMPRCNNILVDCLVVHMNYSAATAISTEIMF